MEMPQASIHFRQSQYCRLLAVILIAFNHDSGGRGGVEAWMYNYSTVPMRNWDSARLWCREHFTDMLAIQNQEEISFLNQLLPFNPQYYWMGIRRLEGVWTWVGTRARLSREAENWADGEPNNLGVGQDCVEIYIKRGEDTAKWNDDNCRKRKGTVCYTASCSTQSCSIHGVCVETIGNYTCLCTAGFLGPRCEAAVACEPVEDPEQGSVVCDHAYGTFRFNSTCQFSCSRGYQLAGEPLLTCQASGNWDNPAPKCQVHQCLTLNSAPSGGSMNCSNPIALNSYNSTCEVSCDEGFELKGPEKIQCDHTGLWTDNVPNCTVVRCPILSSPPLGNMSCVHPLASFSFTSTCSFSCEEGYSLTGDHTLTCLPAGQWTNHTPACEVVQCDALKVPHRASMNCLDPVKPFSYGSACRFTCDEGFLLSGSNTTHCSSQGNWSQQLPVCQVVRCPILSSPPLGNMSCVHPLASFSFNSTCSFSCEEGYSLTGDHTLTCLPAGQWTNHTPACEVVQCDALKVPHRASMNCLDPVKPFSYGSACRFTCDEGFLLSGSNTTHCSSQGNWSQQLPVCQVRPCDTLTVPPHGSSSCSHPHGPFSFGSHCVFSCEEGFQLNGTAQTECSSLGMWTSDVPPCQARPCPLLATPPHHGWRNCSHPYSSFSYRSRCQFGCDEGFLLQGAPSINCNTSGLWSEKAPLCEAVRCEALSTLPPPLSGNCTHPLGNFSLGSECLLSCGEGYSLNGRAGLSCTSRGLWSHPVPTCSAEEAPSGRRMLVYVAAGAGGAVAGILLLVAAALLVKRLTGKTGQPNMNSSSFEERENPAFQPDD
ncbi:P-selectin isoform X2 [Hypomesus transpacificus]|uniref:P-selectin isoform X2 n=1 Tax=Hypomesus transpacificus TaxID=137520 RepID=UPI001F084D9C|nr:P-selectin isoform X2 [Hypomesus transpacificus]